MTGGAWVRDVQGRIAADHLSEFVNLWAKVNAAGQLSEDHDEFAWKLTDSGAFSTTSAYQLQELAGA